MLNDRFNGGSGNDFEGKFRDKKFVSAVAIGVFVLILVIVLAAKGCSGKKRQQTTQPQPPQTTVQPQQPQPIDVPPPPEYVKTAAEWREEGKKFLNEKKFAQARESLAEAAKLGDKQAKILLAKDPRLKVRK